MAAEYSTVLASFNFKMEAQSQPGISRTFVHKMGKVRSGTKQSLFLDLDE
jgi:hypothetical protein